MQASYSATFADTIYQRHVHRTFQSARERIVMALQVEIDAEPAVEPVAEATHATKMLNRLTECCRHPSIVQNDQTGEVHISESRCRSRVCPRCGRVRTRELGHRLRGLLKFIDSPRMLTLTLKSNGDPLSEQLRRLNDAFRRLRRRKNWKKHVTGGLFIVEITWNHAKHEWHPHIHALIDGEFWKQADIADEWETVTGDSRIVDIRMIYGRESAVGYITKYMSKSQLSDQIPAGRIVEWSQNTHGARMVGTFGKLHGVKIEMEEDEREGGYEQVAPLEPLLEASERGEAEAKSICEQLRLVRRRQFSDGEPLDDAEYERRCRSVADSLRAWWAGKQRISSHHDPNVIKNNSGPDCADHRSERLWQDADAERNPVGIRD